MTNPFEKLRRPGIIGKVARNFESLIVFQRGTESITIYLAELMPGKWGVGYLVTRHDKRLQLLPGEGSGWFGTRNDALLYGLGMMRSRQDIFSVDANFAVKAAINKTRNVSLFD